jgi:hypothetical protein
MSIVETEQAASLPHYPAEAWGIETEPTFLPGAPQVLFSK